MTGTLPTWSPDGTEIAYSRSGDIFVADVVTGTETLLIGGPDSENNPAWSPDGSNIAFTRHVGDPIDGDTDIWLADADGSNAVKLRDDPTVDDSQPDWSPDGSKIVFTVAPGVNGSIHVINADGTGLQTLTLPGSNDGSPVWSPDGTKIAFSAQRLGAPTGVMVMNADGTGIQRITTPASGFALAPSWGPAVTAYPRPAGASPLRVPLVPTYNFCFSSNETHGPPLAFASCSPPTQQSLTLTVGTPDANGAAAASVASARIATVVGDPETPGDQADVTVSISATDVRCLAANAACPGGAGSQFTGTTLFTMLARVTDRVDGLLSTTGLVSFVAPVACAPTPNPDVGSTCALSTTMDAVTPGLIPEGRRSIWEVTSAELWDPGPNGTGYANCPPTCGNGDETPFLRQGLFVP